MKLSEKLQQNHDSGDFGEALEGYADEAKTLEVWERFASYLVDCCEGETITEENIQHWLDDMLASESEHQAGQ